VPNKLEDTVVTPEETQEVPTGNQPEAISETPSETTTPSDSTDEMISVKKSDWESGQTEVKRLRSGQSTLERKLARYERQTGQDSENGDFADRFGGDKEKLAEWAQNPMTQDLLLKAAEVELKEGVRELLNDYPDVPESIKKAITKNPRGFVNTGTMFVDDALLDIEDYLAELSQGAGGDNTAPNAQPKEFPVAGTNAGGEAAADTEVEKVISLLSGGKDGVNEAFRLLTDKEVTQEVFDAATAEAERRGILASR